MQEGAVVTALNGDGLTVTSLDPPTINDAVVVTADIRASNGVVHLIDKVLLPPAVETPQEPAGTQAPETMPPATNTTEPPGEVTEESTPAPSPVSTEVDTSSSAVVSTMIASSVAMIVAFL